MSTAVDVLQDLLADVPATELERVRRLAAARAMALAASSDDESRAWSLVYQFVAACAEVALLTQRHGVTL